MTGNGKFQTEKNTIFESSTASVVDKGPQSCESNQKLLLQIIPKKYQNDGEVRQREINICYGYNKENVKTSPGTMPMEANRTAAFKPLIAKDRSLREGRDPKKRKVGKSLRKKEGKIPKYDMKF